jgi:hypothetical protein
MFRTMTLSSSPTEAGNGAANWQREELRQKLREFTALCAPATYNAAAHHRHGSGPRSLGNGRNGFITRRYPAPSKGGRRFWQKPAQTTRYGPEVESLLGAGRFPATMR